MRDRRTCEGMKVFEQRLKKVLVFPKASPTWFFNVFSYQRSRVDRPGESDANEKLVDEEEEKLKVTQDYFSQFTFNFRLLLLPTLPHDHKARTQIRQDAGLVRSGRLFGGLLNDIKRKKPHYLSDFRSAKIELFNYSCWPRLMIVLMVFPK